MVNEWCQELLRCAEGLYVLEESKKIVWVNPYLTDGLNASCVGEPCWKAFLGRQDPALSVLYSPKKDGIYVWDYFERINYGKYGFNNFRKLDGMAACCCRCSEKAKVEREENHIRPTCSVCGQSLVNIVSPRKARHFYKNPDGPNTENCKEMSI